MSRHVISLALILLIQCALVAVLYWPASDSMNATDFKALLPINPDSIDEIYLEDEQGQETVLLKPSENWILPDLAGIPVDTSMVEHLVSSISDTAGKWPVGATPAARQRFQVAAYRFQRRLTLISEGELLATVYLGTSPAFRKVHARNDNQDNIFSIEFSNHEAPVAPEGWLDKTLMQFSSPTKISSEGFSIEKQGETWVSDLGVEPDSRELSALLLGLTSLQVEGFASQEMRDTLGFTAPDLILEIESADRSVQLALLSVGDRHFLQSSKYDYFFRLSAYDFDRLASIDGTKLAGMAAPLLAPEPREEIPTD